MILPSFKCVCGADALIETPDGNSICPDHCKNHEYEFEDGCGWTCLHCGAEPPSDFYDDEY
jgi:hypothetical protein